MTAVRSVAKAVARAVFSDGRIGSAVVLIVEDSVRDKVEHRFETGTKYSICGWLEYRNQNLEGSVNGSPVSVTVSDLPNALQGTKVDDVFVCVPTVSDRQATAIIDSVERLGANCHVAINLLDPGIQGAVLDSFGGLPTISFAGRGSMFYRKVAKRAIDIVVSLLVVIVALIPGMILSLVISLQSKGAPLYSEKRLGVGGKPFKLYKFRSMVADADNVEKYLSPEQLKEWLQERKVDNDPRVTKVGRFLRKTSLDEFPQFVNVLKGDMSIVGPRPIVAEELANYGDRADEFLSCRPGVTGWWQVEARNKADYASGTRQELELYYVRHASFSLDWNIFVRTFGAVFHGTGK
jgi:lipopolysaccharide/colanic/teichoic acid biosynthesis glycosyltransferase